jgi:hypothetical protein
MFGLTVHAVVGIGYGGCSFKDFFTKYYMFLEWYRLVVCGISQAVYFRFPVYVGVAVWT